MDAYQERQRAARTNLLIEDDNVTDDDLLPPAHDQLREAVKEMLQEERLVAVVAGEAQRSDWRAASWLLARVYPQHWTTTKDEQRRRPLIREST